MRTSLLLGFLVLVAAPATAQDMNAQTLYEMGVALQKKGPLALVSGDMKTVRREIQGAADAARAQARADKAAGRSQRFCAPEAKQSMGSSELLRRVEQIPEAERRKIDSQELITRVFAQKYPCA